MKLFAPILALSLALALAACGEEDSSGGSAQSESGQPNAASAPASDDAPQLAKSSKEARERSEPKIQARSGPPPKQVVSKDLIKGTGAEIEVGRPFEPAWTAVYYKTGKWRESSWDTGEKYTFNYGVGQTVEGWEVGLKGMKVGGRREVIVPSKLAYGDGAIVYIVDLLGVR
jgi:peptidylprolyl isomerase